MLIQPPGRALANIRNLLSSVHLLFVGALNQALGTIVKSIDSKSRVKSVSVYFSSGLQCVISRESALFFFTWFIFLDLSLVMDPLPNLSEHFI